MAIEYLLLLKGHTHIYNPQEAAVNPHTREIERKQ